MHQEILAHNLSQTQEQNQRIYWTSFTKILTILPFGMNTELVPLPIILVDEGFHLFISSKFIMVKPLQNQMGNIIKFFHSKIYRNRR